MQAKNRDRRKCCHTGDRQAKETRRVGREAGNGSEFSHCNRGSTAKPCKRKKKQRIPSLSPPPLISFDSIPKATYNTNPRSATIGLMVKEFNYL